jgi:hypothetical protein
MKLYLKDETTADLKTIPPKTANNLSHEDFIDAWNEFYFKVKRHVSDKARPE